MNLIPLPVAYALAAVAALMLACCAAAPLFKCLAALWEKSRGDKFGRYVFLAAVAGATLYGGAKHKTGGISYPFTDPEIKYLIDAGSYVTNDAVHVAFTRLIAPATAPLLIDRRQVDQTNETDWVSFTNTTFAAFANPCDIQCPAATNWDWIVYTTWTPGPTVQTNGVWHAHWGLDKKERAYIIPVRTCVRDGSTIIATPKSRWDAEAATDETEEVTNEAD